MAWLIYSMSVSLDGYVETAGHSLEWAIIDEELHRHFAWRRRAGFASGVVLLRYRPVANA